MIKDSGDRTEFETGAKRDMHAGKGRMDLLPWYGIMEVSKHCEEGALKYGEHNVDKGIPLHSLWALNQRVTHPELDDRFSTDLKREFLKKKFTIPEMKIARPDHQPVNVKCLECGDVRGILKQSWDNGLAGLTVHDKLLTCPICGVLTSHILVEKVGKSDE